MLKVGQAPLEPVGTLHRWRFKSRRQPPACRRSARCGQISASDLWPKSLRALSRADVPSYQLETPVSMYILL